MRELINVIDEAVDQDLMSYLKAAGYEDLRAKGNNLLVLAQIPDGAKKNEFRRQIFTDVFDNLKNNFSHLGPYIGSDTRISSLGFIGFSEIPTRVVVKDAGIQGDNSSGVANETELAGMLQSMVEKYKSIDVVFKDPRGKTLSIDGVDNVELTGKDVKEKKKADIVLRSSEKRLPVSIKKLDAETWESADTMFGAKAREIIDDLVEKDLVDLEKISDQAGYRLSKEIVVEPTEEEAMLAIFGSDIQHEGGIVIQTFRPEHFVQEGNQITIDCHAVIKEKSDIPESHMMVWLIRNNAGRLSRALGIRGLRPMASILSRAIGRKGDKDVILVDKDGNVVERPGKSKPTAKAKPKPEIGSDNALGRKRR